MQLRVDVDRGVRAVVDPRERRDRQDVETRAGVYERDGDRLVVNAPNCIDCKATDVLGPRWTPREGGGA